MQRSVSANLGQSIDDRASSADDVVWQLNWIINPRRCRHRPVMGPNDATTVNLLVDKTVERAGRLHRLAGSHLRRIRVIS